jgi:hypothetical protein
MTNGSGKPDQDVSPEQPVREQQPDPDGSNNLTDGSAIKDIEKRNKKKRVKPSLSSDKNSGEILFQIWNEHRGTLPKANALTANRKRHCRARIADNPDPDYWVRVVKTMATSSFLTGQNDRGWTADFDFLLKPDTHAKVSEGKYLDRHPKRPPEPQGIVVEAKERHGTDNPFT